MWIKVKSAVVKYNILAFLCNRTYLSPSRKSLKTRLKFSRPLQCLQFHRIALHNLLMIGDFIWWNPSGPLPQR